jgi:hypothetical protein
MYQLGGHYLEEFFPRTRCWKFSSPTGLARGSQADGAWPVDSHWHDGMFGSAYTTSLIVISLGAPNQLLPIFQR